ncbi:MAG: hypothetical protein OEO21_02205 [Candidatus Krumholzibacteria bacterium]|nr:hypothetical protein [Candidatus Krumholzibacteria bacterium]
MVRHLLIAAAAFAALGVAWAVILLLARRFHRTPSDADLPACGSCAVGPCHCAGDPAIDRREARASAGTAQAIDSTRN